jgi:hypothetical protein
LHLLLLYVLWLSDLVELVEELGDFVELSLVCDHKVVFVALPLTPLIVIRNKNRADEVGALFLRQW